MAWDSEMVTLLRHMVGDVVSPYTYDDVRLQELILTSSQLIQSEIVFATTYTVDITGASLSPDPTDTTTRDNTFINFALLKAACIIDNAEARLGSKRSVRMQDGDKEIDAREVGKNVLEILKRGWCVTYNEVKFNYLCGSGNLGQAIIGPFREFAGVGHTTWTADESAGICEGRYR